ncbi:hypothetical protein TGAMA5MH_04595 [Trichoderma gamsii]|uniref:C2H2-type domain-containing protein n=1 Tax=Trichoderma gamsii TaxID=398673 RepID=A0A2K0TDM4_9HYPO|nr:hypothetical protein TGAMA5MH_04595 [Trichoderma gamsii]
MSTWYCDVGHENVLQFNDHESFVRHMKDPANHKDRRPPTNLQLDTLSSDKQRFLVRDEEYCCPLCECVPDTLEPMIASSDPDKIRRFLHEHISDHLEDLAFEIIPTLEEAEPSEDIQCEVGDDSHRRLLGSDSMASYPSGLHELRQETSLAFEDGSDRGSDATGITDLVCMSNRSIVEEEWEEGEEKEAWEEWKEGKYKAAIGLPGQDPILDHFARTQRQTSQPPRRPSRPQSRLSEADTLIVEHGEGRLFDTTDFVDQEE